MTKTVVGVGTNYTLRNDSWQSDRFSICAIRAIDIKTLSFSKRYWAKARYPNLVKLIDIVPVVSLTPNESLWAIISFCHFTLTNPIQILVRLGAPALTAPHQTGPYQREYYFKRPCQPRWAFRAPKSSLLWMKLQKSNKVNTTERQQKLARKKAKLNSNWFRRVLGTAGGVFQDAYRNV